MEENKTNVAEENATYSEETTIMVATQSDESETTGEIEELGSADRRVFDLGDGEFKAVYYPVTDDGETPMQEFSVYSYQGTKNKIGMDGTTARRAYFTMAKPTLVSNPRIKKAELVLRQSDVTQSEENVKLGLYEANVIIDNEGEIAETTQIYTLIDYLKMKFPIADETVSYAFDITSLIDQLLNGEAEKVGFVVKLIDETIASGNCMTFSVGNSKEAVCPTVEITYESTYGVNTSYRTDTHELGRFGQGSVDLMCGNLMFESEDFAWQGNRMPVTIKHLYNSGLSEHQYTHGNAGLNTADFSAMKLGKGWKLNVMQSIKEETFIHDGVYYDGVVYISAQGDVIRFRKASYVVCDDSEFKYDYESVIGNRWFYSKQNNRITNGKETYHFDDKGRLLSVFDKYGNSVSIEYSNDRIVRVRDGIGRVFEFSYIGDKEEDDTMDGLALGFLSSITAPDLTSVSYEYDYSSGHLTEIIYPNGGKVKINYELDKPKSIIFFDEDNCAVRRFAYTYVNNRLSSIVEYSGDSVECRNTKYVYSASSKRAVVERLINNDDGSMDSNRTVYLLNDKGLIANQYAYSQKIIDEGNEDIDYINPNVEDGMAGVVINVDNLIRGHSFENLDNWCGENANNEDIEIAIHRDAAIAKFGGSYLNIVSNDSECCENGIYQTVNNLPAGEYTFSAYVNIMEKYAIKRNFNVYIRAVNSDGVILAESMHIDSSDEEYMRLIVPFKIETEQDITLHILVNGMGGVYVDGVQLENNPYANEYNMIESGNFDSGADKWYVESSSGCVEIGASTINGISISETNSFNMNKVLKIIGDIEEKKCVYQDVSVKKLVGTRETFTLSGWAKGCGLVSNEREGCEKPRFQLCAKIYYSDGTSDESPAVAMFSSCTHEWQFASVKFTKKQYKAIDHICIICDYSFNVGEVYFDNVQLIRNDIENDLSRTDFFANKQGNVKTFTPKEKTEIGFEEVYDEFGNVLTETTFADGEMGTIYRAFTFDESDGNNKTKDIDARGNTTEYVADYLTSRNEEIIDRCENKISYTYDEDGRITKISHKKTDDTEVSNVCYSYDTFNNITEIVRGDGMKYSLKYNSFNNLESIGVTGKTDGDLITYTYKDGNGRIKEIAYANGDKITATYNAAGQLTHETWTNSENVEVAKYIYAYDGHGNILRSIDKYAQKEYNYYYEGGRIICATECDIIMNDLEIVTSKMMVSSIRYTYDEDGNLAKKVITPTGETPFTYYYETTNDNTVVKFVVGGKSVTCHSKTDGLGRKEFDEIQSGSGFISRRFAYHAGTISKEHQENDKLRSTATTQLVSQIILSDGRTISYEYDGEERITKIIDSIDGITEYTYDALGQVLTETKEGVVVNNVIYNGYGNILSKNGAMYFYDQTWKDKLIQISSNITDDNGTITGITSKTITYDEQGNPTNYFGNMLEWEKGRQLKRFNKYSSFGLLGSYTYTYNADGIRTSKTVNTTTYKYTLDGTKILKEEIHIGRNVFRLIPLYDNLDSVCGIVYNDIPYYFLKNLQGDVIAITDQTGEVIANYTYDAWGVCTVEAGSHSIANTNPFRYRGYYYDYETGFYYLQSRYYDPLTGRFINADHASLIMAGEGVKHCGLFSYCENDVVNRIDYNGFISLSSISITKHNGKMTFEFQFFASKEELEEITFWVSIITEALILISLNYAKGQGKILANTAVLVPVFFAVVGHMLDKYLDDMMLTVSFSINVKSVTQYFLGAPCTNYTLSFGGISIYPATLKCL